MLCYDSGYLYVGLRADIDWEPGIVPVKFDDLNIWTVDSFDIALIPVPEKANDIVRFIVERGGGRADMRAKGQVKQPAGDWNPEWKSAVRLIAHSYMSAYTWEAEIAIPWKSLGICAPERRQNSGTVYPLYRQYPPRCRRKSGPCRYMVASAERAGLDQPG